MPLLLLFCSHNKLNTKRVLSRRINSNFFLSLSSSSFHSIRLLYLQSPSHLSSLLHSEEQRRNAPSKKKHVISLQSNDLLANFWIGHFWLLHSLKKWDSRLFSFFPSFLKNNLNFRIDFVEHFLYYFDRLPFLFRPFYSITDPKGASRDGQHPCRAKSSRSGPNSFGYPNSRVFS